MKDVAGRDLEIGDIVAASYIGYLDLQIGEIVRFSSNRILVKFNRRDSTGTVRTHDEHKFPKEVCFIRKAQVLL